MFCWATTLKRYFLWICFYQLPGEYFPSKHVFTKKKGNMLIHLWENIGKEQKDIEREKVRAEILLTIWCGMYRLNALNNWL